MTTYNLAPEPIWALHDNNGQPLANGYMFTMDNANPSNQKPVYQDIGGTLPYSQPIYFGSGGFQGPFYWADDGFYLLNIYTSDGQLVKTIRNYNAPGAGGGGPSIMTFVDINNLIQDGQFNYPVLNNIPITALDTQITSYGWHFAKDNLTGTDTITFAPLTLGTFPPDNTPVNMITVANTSAGSGETYKDLYYKIPKVESLNGRIISFSFWGINNAVNPNVSVLFKQNFGTGGAPSADSFSASASFVLTNNWARYTGNITIPSTSGKTLGTNGDDYLSMIWRVPIDSTFSHSYTTMQLNDYDQVLSFDFRTPPQAIQLPYYNSVTTRNKYLHINNSGYLDWSSALPVGAVIAWPMPPATIPSDYLYMNATLHNVADYPTLYALLGNTYGGVPGVTFGVPDFRGLFPRGWDDGRGLDTPRAFPSFQVYSISNHSHSITLTASGGGFGANQPATASTGFINSGLGASETRPYNYTVIYIIKAL